MKAIWSRASEHMEGKEESGSRQWQPGEAVPWFTAPTLQGNACFDFATIAGRHVLLFFAGSAGIATVAQSIARLGGCRDLLDDHKACFFGVTADPEDARAGRIAKLLPGFRWFLDYDGRVSRMFGTIDGRNRYSPVWLLLDPMLRVVETAGPSEVDRLLATLRVMVETASHEQPAPVAIVPRIFEPELCRRLIALYETHGGQVSGFMRDVAGATTGFVDGSVKRRLDYRIDDEELRRTLLQRLETRLLPVIRRVFQFETSHVERHIVACYDGDGEGGFFKPHRDDTAVGAAHRRFACTINLNAEEYDGGELIFPEFGTRTYRGPTGGAVVFSCSLLHGAEPVTRGKRYAYLPFLYDDAAAEQRAAYLAGPEAGSSG